MAVLEVLVAPPPDDLERVRRRDVERPVRLRGATLAVVTAALRAVAVVGALLFVVPPAALVVALAALLAVVAPRARPPPLRRRRRQFDDGVRLLPLGMLPARLLTVLTRPYS